MDYIYTYVKNVCVFTLLITLVLNIFPDRQYKKYIKLFAGLLLLALIFNPIIRYKNIKTELDKIISQYTKGSYHIDMEEEIDNLESKMYERVSDEYKWNSQYYEE